MESKTEQLMRLIRRSPLFDQFVPQEAGFGWPIPLRRENRVYIILPLFGYTPFAEGKQQTVLFPPFATITVDWSNGLLVEYVNLRFRNPWPEGAWEVQAGTFPHQLIAGMTVKEYNELRNKLLCMYDEMFDALVERRPFSPAWSAEFSRLQRISMEPGLEPFYRALGPKFFERFLPTQ